VIRREAARITDMSQPILIIGAGGKTGRRVAERLRREGMPIRLVSRSTTPSFDWMRPETWAPALEGVSKAYVTFQPDLAVEGASVAIGSLADMARDKGLDHIVLLSGRGEPGAQRAEAALHSSGLDWSIVRASWFNQNFSEGYLLDGVIEGRISLPAGPVPEPFIDVGDIADVVTATLTEERHRNRLYEVTGPMALTFEEAVSEIAAATGLPVLYEQISPEAFAAALRPHLPEDLVSLLIELFTVVLDGRNMAVAHGVEEALGRPPREFRDWARSTAATGVWMRRPHR
jgi:uncharacterized protein YbjT (DUF2867 family)